MKSDFLNSFKFCKIILKICVLMIVGLFTWRFGHENYALGLFTFAIGLIFYQMLKLMKIK